MTEDHERLGAGAALDSSAAMVRAESETLDATLHALVSRLSSVPALEMKVTYRHGRLRRLIGDIPYINDLHRRTDPIREIQVTLGSRTYWLRSRPAAITCGQVTEVSDPTVSREEPFPAWASALFEDIARQNLANHESRAALRDLVEQDRVR